MPDGTAPGPEASDSAVEDESLDISDLEPELQPEPDSLDWASRAALRNLLHAVEAHLAENNQEPDDTLYHAMMLAKSELNS